LYNVRQSRYESAVKLRVWSRGLGKVELAIDLKKAHIVYERKKIYIMGKTEPPVSWDFVMSVDAAEVGRLVRAFGNKQGIQLIGQYAKMRLFSPKELKTRYVEATKTRTGVRPDQEYAPLLGKKK